jgi:hypothetical protein
VRPGVSIQSMIRTYVTGQLRYVPGAARYVRLNNGPYIKNFTWQLDIIDGEFLSKLGPQSG